MPNVKAGVQEGNARKTAAAIAAVLQYIKTEEEAIAMQSAQLPMPRFGLPPSPASRSWGISGRQAQMQMRNLMQLRTFRKL